MLTMHGQFALTVHRDRIGVQKRVTQRAERTPRMSFMRLRTLAKGGGTFFRP